MLRLMIDLRLCRTYARMIQQENAKDIHARVDIFLPAANHVCACTRVRVRMRECVRACVCKRERGGGGREGGREGEIQ